MTTKTAQDWIAEENRREAREALLTARATLERAIREVDGYIEHFDAATDDKQRARVINWTISHLASNIISSLRVDRLADAQAKLTKLAE